MSEKRVNIKITASTSGFDSAIKKAQRQIEDLAKEIESLGSSKFGSTLEGQINDLVKALKEAEEQVSNVKKVLDDLDGTNLSKTEKGLEGIKDKMKDLTESGEKVVKSMDDIQDTLSKVDKSDLGGLDKSFTKVKSTVENLGKEMRDATDNVEKNFSNLAEGADKFSRKINDIDGSGIKKINNTFEDVVRDILKAEGAVDDLAKKFKNLDGTMNFDSIQKFAKGDLTLAKDIMNDLVDNGGDLKKVLSDIDAKGLQGYKDSLYGGKYKSKDSWSDSSNKKNTNSIVEGLVSGTVAAKAMEHSIGGVADAMREATAGIREMPNSLQETVSYFHNLNQEVASNKNRLDELNKEYTELTKKQDDLTKSKEGLKNSNDITNRVMELAEKHMYEYAERAKELDKALEDAYKTGKTDEEIEKMTKEFQEATKWAEKFQDILTMIRKIDIDEAIDLGLIDEEFREASEAAKELEKQIKDTKKAIADKNKEAQGFADDFEKEYKAYQSLSKAVKAYLEDEEKSILQREKVAKSFKDLSSEMEKVYAESKKFNNADLIDKTFKEAAEYIDKLDLASTKNVQRDLERLGEIIDDKTKKIKRFKALNEEFGSEDSRKAFGLEKQSEQLRDYARNVDFVIEAVDELNKAFAQVKVGDDDNLRIRGRMELLQNYGDLLAKTAADIRNKYHDIEKAEDVYNAATPQEKAQLDKYEAWKKNRKEIEKYIQAIDEYRSTMKDLGGQVDSKFLDEFGKFDARKFIEDFDKMGTSSAVLQKQMNAVKSELLENIKAEKENAAAMQDSAKEAERQAKLNLELAKSHRDVIKAEIEKANKIKDTSKAMKDASDASDEYYDDKENSKKLAEAIEAVTKAEKEYAEAKKQSGNYDDDRVEKAKQLIKAYNEQAEAMRKMGMAAKDIGREDIEKFDRSLASLLDDAGAFGDDLPKTFKDFKEDIKALFADMDSFKFDGVFDGLKEIGGGLLSKIPADLKAAAAAALAFGTAMKKCAEIGINQFGRGMDTIKNGLSKFTGIARDVGQEVRDAFENITGMHLDASSLMEIPVEFEATMDQVGAITGTIFDKNGNADRTNSAYQQLIKLARELGGTTRYSATEAAEAMVLLGQSGWDAQDMIQGLPSVLHMATIENMSLADSASFLSDALNTMGMQTYQASDAADMLVATSISANTSVSQLKMAYGNAASTAGTLGVSMSDLNVVLGAMADKGIKGAKAGTALKNLMANMSAPTEKQTKCIEKYNLAAAQTAITNGKLVEGVQLMQGAIDGLTAKEKTAVITTIAGKEALSGIAALMNTSAEDMNKLKFAVDSSTKSSRLYAQSLGLIDGAGNMINKTTGKITNSFEEMKNSQGKAYDQWVNFNKIMNETDDAGNSLVDVMQVVGGTSTDLGAIIHKLGEDGSVTKEEVGEVVEVFNKLNEAAEDGSSVLSEFGIEVAKTDEGTIDFSETLKNLGARWDTLTDAQKASVAEQLGISGSIEELNELFADNGEQIESLIESYDRMKGVAEHVAETFDANFKGSLLNLASAMEERLLQVFDKVKPALQGLADEFTEFFSIWNNMGQENTGLSGLEGALAYLEKTSQGWGDAIAKGLSNAISSINDFVGSVSFDNLLQVGTNIIDGIARGISTAANNGTLDSAISTAINKIATWFSNNLDTLIEAGSQIVDSISKGISDNGPEIGEAIRSVINLQNGIDAAVAEAKWKMIGDNLVTFICEGIESKVSVFTASLKGFFSTGITEALSGALSFIGSSISTVFGDPFMAMGKEGAKLFGKGMLEAFDFDLGNILSSIKERFTGTAFAESPSGATPLGGSSPIDIINQNLSTGKATTDATAASIGQGISDNIIAKLETMDASGLQALNTEMLNLQTTVQTVATGMGTSFTAIQDSARISFMGLTNIVNNQMLNCINTIRTQMVGIANIITNQVANARNAFTQQFMSMAAVARTQMTNVSNIVRNQAQSWSNVIRNQVTNARNALTSQFLSMAAVARTQMVNISNIVRNQATAWANIVRNQSANMKSAMTSAFAGMAAAAASGMARVLSTVRSYMSQIVAATNRTMTMNFRVNRSITTTNTVRTVAAPAAANAMYAANAASTYSLRSGDASALASRASSAITTSSSKGAVSSNNNDGITLEIPVMLDGKELARGTAKYVDGELKMKQKRDDRKRGVK